MGGSDEGVRELRGRRNEGILIRDDRSVRIGSNEASDILATIVDGRRDEKTHL